jgi:hypothetical protein
MPHRRLRSVQNESREPETETRNPAIRVLRTAGIGATSPFARAPARTGIHPTSLFDGAGKCGAFRLQPRSALLRQTHRWREKDSNPRYQVRRTTLPKKPFPLVWHFQFSPKTDSSGRGTDGSNPSPSSSGSVSAANSGAGGEEPRACPCHCVIHHHSINQVKGLRLPCGAEITK